MLRPQPAATSPLLDHVVPAATFHNVLQRERMRADRGGQPFSLLQFTPPAQRAATAGNPLREYLQVRLRATDLVGAYGDGRLVVLLVDTDRRGAQTLLDDIRQHGPPAARNRATSIQTYPTDMSDADVARLDHADVADVEDADVANESLLFAQPMPAWKRSADLVLATTSLILFSPIMAAAAVLIKLTSPGPILFCQYRAGLGGRPFLVYKFRTMHDGAAQQQAALRAQSDQDGPAFKLANDPRVTWVGDYLRKTCIDEFPQFWNVLRGEMSIVGPRPLPLDEAANCTNWQRRRLDVTPGMTCIWQVSGGLRVSFVEWMRMDLRYIRQRSLKQDLKLLVKTARAILLRRASQ